jgi:4-amino-4-deoxy-L-arabinose transferase-like glycosyltransferase
MKYLLTRINNLMSNSIFLAVLIILLSIPALLVNLGLHPLINDEGIRGLVSLEMILRNNFITPTLGGELYFSKPPLYNWIIIVFFKLFNSYSDFILRLPTVVFIYLYSASVFLVIRKFYGARIGLINALAFLTCGRILFYDSFKGLIDTSFSWLVFLSFFAVYYFSGKEKYLFLYLLSYLITALAFLMKGLPAVAFQGITLLVWFIAEKKWKKLFSWQHVAGIFLFFTILICYYYAYYQQNPDHFLTLIKTIFEESTKKTVISTGFPLAIKHLFTFPIEFTYHFLPWTIFAIYLFRKKAIKSIWNEPYLRFCVLIFLSNILVYWISPITYARYLFMFLPLAFAPLIFLHLKEEARKTLLYKVVNSFIITFIIAVLIGSGLLMVLNITRNVPMAVVKGSCILVSLVLILFIYVKKKDLRLEYLIILLLITRIGFDWFIIPTRYNSTLQSIVKDEIKQINEIAGNNTIHYDYKITECMTREMYHLTVYRHSIAQYDTLYEKGYYLIQDTGKISNKTFRKLGDLHTNKGGDLYSFVKIE